MIGGDSKFVLTCTHTHVPAPTHTTTHIISLETRKRLAKWGSGLKKKELVFFPVLTLAMPMPTSQVVLPSKLHWFGGERETHEDSNGEE